MDVQTCRILIVDDDKDFARAAAALAETHQAKTVAVHNLADARRVTANEDFDLILLDLGLPDGSGFDLLPHIDLSRNGPVAIVTATPSVESAAEAVRSSVFDYLVKPICPARFDALLKRAIAGVAPSRASAMAQACGDFIGSSAAMREMYHQLQRVAPTDATVLICGESGTGKELAAQAIHAHSGRQGRFVAVNCGAVAPELLASQLFGHEKGSFTGALKRHEGYFEQARGGTVFLDEITEMPLSLQPHLLRVLETRTLTRVGGDREDEVDVRVIAATNRAPEAAVAEGGLRADLFYRLSDFPLRMPALREHADDVPVIAQTFLDRLNERYATHKRFDPTLLRRLCAYDWPGNVRELRNVVQQAFILAEGEVLYPVLPQARRHEAAEESHYAVTFNVGTPMVDIEARMLMKTLAHFDNDKVKTAEALGVSVKTVYNWLARFGGATPA